MHILRGMVKQAFEQQGLTAYRVAKLANIGLSSFTAFIAEKQDMRGAQLSRVMEVLGIANNVDYCNMVKDKLIEVGDQFSFIEDANNLFIGGELLEFVSSMHPLMITKDLYRLHLSYKTKLNNLIIKLKEGNHEQI